MTTLFFLANLNPFGATVYHILPKQNDKKIVKEDNLLVFSDVLDVHAAGDFLHIKGGKLVLLPTSFCTLSCMEFKIASTRICPSTWVLSGVHCWCWFWRTLNFWILWNPWSATLLPSSWSTSGAFQRLFLKRYGEYVVVTLSSSGACTTYLWYIQRIKLRLKNDDLLATLDMLWVDTISENPPCVFTYLQLFSVQLREMQIGTNPGSCRWHYQ